MAVGDNLNDVDMLELAGHPVVMGNAVAELKRCGWPLTAGHDEAGLARAIHRPGAPSLVPVGKKFQAEARATRVRPHSRNGGTRRDRTSA